MADFDTEGRVARGTAEVARDWVSASGLNEAERDDLAAFVDNHDSLTFVQERDALLDAYAADARVILPPWFRAVRTTLAFVYPPQLVRVDDFIWDDSPYSEDVEDLWFEMFTGYSDPEQRDLFADRAASTPSVAAQISTSTSTSASPCPIRTTGVSSPGPRPTSATIIWTAGHRASRYLPSSSRTRSSLRTSSTCAHGPETGRISDARGSA